MLSRICQIRMLLNFFFMICCCLTYLTFFSYMESTIYDDSSSSLNPAYPFNAQRRFRARLFEIPLNHIISLALLSHFTSPRYIFSVFPLPITSSPNKRYPLPSPSPEVTKNANLRPTPFFRRADPALNPYPSTKAEAHVPRTIF